MIALLLVAVLGMDEKKDVDVVCPIDGTKFRAVEIVSSNSWGGVDADNCPHAIKTTPLEFRVWTCPTCYYSGLKGAFDPKFAEFKSTLAGKLKPLVDIKKNAKQADIPGHVKFDLMAQAAILRGAPPEEVGNAYLWASWVERQKGSVYLEDFEEWETVRTSYGLNKSPIDLGKNKNRTEHELGQLERMAKDAAKLKGNTALLTKYTGMYVSRLHGENVEALKWLEEIRKQKGQNSVVEDGAEAMAKSIDVERGYQKKAAEQYAKALEAGKLEAKAQSQIKYLLGELYRRMGDTKAANEWFDKAIQDADKDLKALAEKQKAQVK
jgi:tetratricopeptide (TPR) repeat protein